MLAKNTMLAVLPLVFLTFQLSFAKNIALPAEITLAKITKITEITKDTFPPYRSSFQHEDEFYSERDLNAQRTIRPTQYQPTSYASQPARKVNKSNTSFFTSSEREINVHNFNAGLQKMEEEYSGFKIEIVNTDTQLPPSHSVFRAHGKIVMDSSVDGNFSYMIGSFENKDGALNFINRVIRFRYPEAKVVQYQNGVRIN